MIEVLIQKLCEEAIVPSYAHKGDSGVDLYSRVDYNLQPGERYLVPTGLKVAIPFGYEGQVRPKSGLALKKGITVLNTPGTVDSPYRGEVGVILINQDAYSTYEIKKGEKIAQMVFSKVEEAEFKVVPSLDETTRGKGGFGSTGQTAK